MTTHQSEGTNTMADIPGPRTSPLAGDLIASDFDGWTAELRQEFRNNHHNNQVGGQLLSENDLVKVWSIRLAPGERLPAHRHNLDYFWTVLTACTGRQHTGDGTTRQVSYTAGETRHFTFPDEQHLLHDLENTSNHEMAFLTVEHKPRQTVRKAK
jgi:quercetin dioxygenase-like cupin family protein